MDTREHNDTTSKRGGYKRSWGKWVGLYLLIGGIAYLLIYLLAFHHGSGAGGGFGY
ncbi:MAG: hypothetical protein ACXVPP_06875 [Actinomycetota bacterium]